MRRLTHWASLAFTVALLLRVFTLGAYPLTDSTEARYAEMARQMVVTGNWLTPMFDAASQTPFWGKPPLSFWLSALPIQLLGANEFAVRLGPFIALAFTALMLYKWKHILQTRPGVYGDFAIHTHADQRSLLATLVLLTTPLGFIAGGAVMTDMAMVAGTTLAMVAFARSVAQPQAGVDAAAATLHRLRTAPRPLWPGVWRWLFFVGIAIGLLAKGPVALVLVALALLGWLAWRRDPLAALAHVWRRLPWLRGLLLTAALVLPWYALAERATPGFLNYFLIGEHWMRFTQPGWKGDLYGVAHAQPKGRIWLFAVLCTVPWLLAWGAWAWANRRADRAGQAGQAQYQVPMPPVAPHASRAAHAAHATSKPSSAPPGSPTTAPAFHETRYLLCWALAPCVFFTASGNILPAYVLPGLPAFALLVAGAWQRWAERHPKAAAWPALLGLVVPLGFAGVVWWAPQVFEPYSEKGLIERHLPSAATQPGSTDDKAQIVYLFERPDSAAWYTLAQARRVRDMAQAHSLVQSGSPHVLLMLPKQKLGEAEPLQLAAHGWREVGRNALTIAYRQTPAPSTAIPKATP